MGGGVESVENELKFCQSLSPQKLYTEQKSLSPSRARKEMVQREGREEEEEIGCWQARASNAGAGWKKGKESWTVSHLWTAIGSSHEPGTDWTTMLDSLTPHSSNLALVPARRGSMMVSFQRAWMMPMRRPLPSWCCGAGPLVCTIVSGRDCSFEKLGWV